MARVEYSPGMRIIVRGEEWIVKRVETNSLGNQALQVVGISNLVKDYESRFMTDIEKDIEIVDSAKVKFIPDDSALFFIVPWMTLLKSRRMKIRNIPKMER
ncbi:MAG: hypothetical protein IJU93_05530 [Lachnospiraceae bacterium]|nr:hypothetical protein [Lachnospiraceae bacterium]